MNAYMTHECDAIYLFISCIACLHKNKNIDRVDTRYVCWQKAFLPNVGNSAMNYRYHVSNQTFMSVEGDNLRGSKYRPTSDGCIDVSYKHR